MRETGVRNPEQKNEVRRKPQTAVKENLDARKTAAEPIETVAVNPLQEQLDAQKDKYMRLMAEFDNFKKRTAVEFAKTAGNANKALIHDLIEIRETFERALDAKAETDANAFKDGVQMISNKFDAVLAQHGLESFGEVGEKFDPALHDAMMKQPSAEIPEEHVSAIFERGYKLKDSIIRHAKVAVSAGTGS
jgi:molecular chaperone GrpE